MPRLIRVRYLNPLRNNFVNKRTSKKIKCAINLIFTRQQNKNHTPLNRAELGVRLPSSARGISRAGNWNWSWEEPDLVRCYRQVLSTNLELPNKKGKIVSGRKFSQVADSSLSGLATAEQRAQHLIKMPQSDLHILIKFALCSPE